MHVFWLRTLNGKRERERESERGRREEERRKSVSSIFLEKPTKFNNIFI